MRKLAALAIVVAAGQTLAQEAGWHYSPLPGEGDRAALGCAAGSTPEAHSCIAIRCDDDYSIGLYVHTSRPEGDAGTWHLGVDKQSWDVVAEQAADTPYGARFTGDVAALIDEIKNGGAFYLDPPDGELPTDHHIGLSGSLYTINQALYFCAPRVVQESGAETVEETLDP